MVLALAASFLFGAFFVSVGACLVSDWIYEGLKEKAQVYRYNPGKAADKYYPRSKQ